MSNPGEWITFAELCARVPNRSAKTLRRLAKKRVISYRQLVKHGPLEFNWRQVERELRSYETKGTQAEAAVWMDEVPEDVRAELAAHRRLLEAIAQQMGIPSGVFAGEQAGVRHG